jgi:hypothetical protein
VVPETPGCWRRGKWRQARAGGPADEHQVQQHVHDILYCSALLAAVCLGPKPVLGWSLCCRRLLNETS